MIKVLGLLKRKPGVSEAEFHRHWREGHGDLTMRIPGMKECVRKYVQTHRIKNPLPGLERYTHSAMDYDGVVEMWFDSFEDLRKFYAILSDPTACKELREDEDTFIDGKSTVSLMVAEEVPIYERK